MKTVIVLCLLSFRCLNSYALPEVSETSKSKNDPNYFLGFSLDQTGEWCSKDGNFGGEPKVRYFERCAIPTS